MFSVLIGSLLFILFGCIFLAVMTAIDDPINRKEMGIHLPEDDFDSD